MGATKFLPRVWDRLGLEPFEREAAYLRLNSALGPKVRALTERAYDMSVGANARGTLTPADRVALDRQLAREVRGASQGWPWAEGGFLFVFLLSLPGVAFVGTSIAAGVARSKRPTPPPWHEKRARSGRQPGPSTVYTKRSRRVAAKREPRPGPKRGPKGSP